MLEKVVPAKCSWSGIVKKGQLTSAPLSYVVVVSPNRVQFLLSRNGFGLVQS